MKRYCGRDFSADDMLAITRLIEQHPAAKRAFLSRRVCEMFDWLKPDGGLKEMACRVAMLRMQADGLITLPASQMRPRLRTAPSRPMPPMRRARCRFPCMSWRH